MKTITYTDAFNQVLDDESYEDQHFDQNHHEIPLCENNSDIDEYDNDNDLEDCFFQEQEKPSLKIKSYQFELSDDEDSEDEDMYVSNDYAKIQSQLDDNLQLKNCTVALEGKCNWLEKEYSQLRGISSNLSSDIYPHIGTEVFRHRSSSWTFGTNFEPSNIEIVTSIPSAINFKLPPVVKINTFCKYIAEGKICPFGDEQCKFTHPTKSLCKYIAAKEPCLNRKCTFFHPKPPANKKIWFCKNLIQSGKCRFGDKCVFAHTKDEIRQNVATCKFNERCRAVTKEGKKYINLIDCPRKCARLHPHEKISDFVRRMQ